MYFDQQLEQKIFKINQELKFLNQKYTETVQSEKKT